MVVHVAVGGPNIPPGAAPSTYHGAAADGRGQHVAQHRGAELPRAGCGSRGGPAAVQTELLLGGVAALLGLLRQGEPVARLPGLPAAAARPVGGDAAGAGAQRGARQAALHLAAGGHHHQRGPHQGRAAGRPHRDLAAAPERRGGGVS